MNPAGIAITYRIGRGVPRGQFRDRTVIMRRYLLLVFIVGSGLPGLASSASFQGVGMGPPGLSSAVTNVSDDGSTVVGSFFVERVLGPGRPISRRQAFRWNLSQGMQPLGYLDESTSRSSVAWGVSSDGSVVVGASGNSAGAEAFRWDSTNGMQGLGDFPGGPADSVAYATSSDGSVTVGHGGLDNGSSTGLEAVRWDSANGMVSIGNFEDGNFASHATDISGDGTTIVGWGDHDGFYGEGFRWDATTGLQGLGSLPGEQYGTLASAVSYDGSTIVGRARSGNIQQAFRWNAANGMVGLGVLGNNSTPASDALAVSGDGSIVVGYSNGTAFIWDQMNGMRDLSIVLRSLGIDLTGWTLRDAWGVSADGLTIVGNGTNPNGQSEGWIAVIPEPSTGILLGIGLAGLAGAKRHRFVQHSASERPYDDWI